MQRSLTTSRMQSSCWVRAPMFDVRLLGRDSGSHDSSPPWSEIHQNAPKSTPDCTKLPRFVLRGLLQQFHKQHMQHRVSRLPAR